MGLAPHLCRGALIADCSPFDPSAAVPSASAAGDLVSSLSLPEDPTHPSPFTVAIGQPPTTAGLLSWLIATISDDVGLAPADWSEAASDLSASLLAPPESPEKTVHEDSGGGLLDGLAIVVVAVPEPKGLLLHATAVGWALLLRSRRHR